MFGMDNGLEQEYKEDSIHWTKTASICWELKYLGIEMATRILPHYEELYTLVKKWTLKYIRERSGNRVLWDSLKCDNYR